MLAISWALRQRILENRLSGERQYFLALRLGLNPSFISHVLNRSVPVRQGDERVLLLAEAFGVPADQAFEEVQLRG